MLREPGLIKEKQGMTRFGKLVLIGVLAGTLGLIGCSDDSGSGGSTGTGGTPSTGGSGGDGGTGGVGGTGGTPSVEACGAGQEIDDSYTTSVGVVNCNALDVIQVPIEVVLAAKSESADGSEADVRISLNLDEDTIGDLGALVQEALIGEASADVGDVPLTGGVNVPADVPCTIDFTADPDENGTAGPVEVVTPAVVNTFTAVDGSTVVEVLDITFAISQPVPLTLTTKGDDAACTFETVPSVELPAL
jgi:hypothetical protein